MGTCTLRYRQKRQIHRLARHNQVHHTSSRLQSAPVSVVFYSWCTFVWPRDKGSSMAWLIRTR